MWRLSRAPVRRTAIGMTLFALSPLLFLLPQNGADAMNVSGHHGQGHIAFEAVDAMIRAAVESMHFQRVDG